MEAREVTQETPQFMATHDKWDNELKLSALEKQLKAGTDQLDHGEGIVLQSQTDLDNLFQQLIN